MARSRTRLCYMDSRGPLVSIGAHQFRDQQVRHCRHPELAGNTQISSDANTSDFATGEITVYGFRIKDRAGSQGLRCSRFRTDGTVEDLES